MVGPGRLLNGICRDVVKRKTHQSSAAQQDHEDDEGLEPVMLHDGEAGLAKVPPPPAISLIHVYGQTRPSLHAT